MRDSRLVDAVLEYQPEMYSAARLDLIVIGAKPDDCNTIEMTYGHLKTLVQAFNDLSAEVHRLTDIVNDLTGSQDSWDSR
jgi:hypothetical protein